MRLMLPVEWQCQICSLTASAGRPLKISSASLPWEWGNLLFCAWRLWTSYYPLYSRYNATRWRLGGAVRNTCRPCWKLRRVKLWCMNCSSKSCKSAAPNHKLCLLPSKTFLNTASSLERAWASWKDFTASKSVASAVTIRTLQQL